MLLLPRFLNSCNLCLSILSYFQLILRKDVGSRVRPQQHFRQDYPRRGSASSVLCLDPLTPSRLLQIPCHKIFETEHSLAILDAFPVTEGHALLLPKVEGYCALNSFSGECLYRRYATMDAMPSEVAAAFLADLPKLARAVKLGNGESVRRSLVSNDCSQLLVLTVSTSVRTMRNALGRR